jgi:ammonia channel protein AmtB
VSVGKKPIATFATSFSGFRLGASGLRPDSRGLLSFGSGNSFIGGLENVFLRGVGAAPDSDDAATIPAQTFMLYQLMLAIITPALIAGAFAERMKFSAMIAFMVLWSWSSMTRWLIWFGARAGC